MVVACCGRDNDGMSTLTRLLPNDPRQTADDVAVRVLRRRATATGLVLEIEVDLPAGPPARSVNGPRARPPSARPPADEHRQFVSLALAVFAGFAFAATFASVLAIVL
jgi:hypothetical protein